MSIYEKIHDIDGDEILASMNENASLFFYTLFLSRFLATDVCMAAAFMKTSMTSTSMVMKKVRLFMHSRNYEYIHDADVDGDEKLAFINGSASLHFPELKRNS